MEEVARSIRVSSTFRTEDPAQRERGFFFGGLIAGEGWFTVTVANPPRSDSSARLRFVFGVTLASRDRPLLDDLRGVLGFGSIHESKPARAGWQPSSTLTISSRKAHLAATIPFMDTFLLPPARKRVQYEQWKSALLAYELERPRRSGRSICSVDGCDRFVRGRGLCRSHYYRATGY